MRCLWLMQVVAACLLQQSALAAPPVEAPLPAKLPAERDDPITRPITPEESQRMEALVARLDDDRFAAREEAQRELLAIGVPALPALEAATRSPSPEVRHRARQIIFDIQHKSLLAEFQRLAAEKDDARISLERGMWLIARIDSPQLKLADLTQELDAWAEKVRDHVRRQHGPATRPRDLAPRAAVEALCAVLFDPGKGFAGNAADYQNPDNSSLEKVLAARKGLPILLAHVLVAVAQRVEVPIVGIQFPGKYMARYYPAPGVQLDPIIIDAYDGGKILTEEEAIVEAARMNYKLDVVRHLAPSTHRAALARMLRNLGHHYQARGDLQKADRAAAYERALLLPVEIE